MRLTRQTALRLLHYVVPICILLTCIFMRWQNVPFVDQFRMTVFDTYQQISPRTYKDVGVRIVDIDEKSLEEMGQWPWPRTVLAGLIYKLRAAGAQVVGFDVVFAEPDRTSPARVVGDWPRSSATDQIEKLAKTLPDHDELLAQFISGTGQIVTAIQLTNKKTELPPRQVGNFSASGEAGRSLSDFIPVLPGAAKNLDVIEAAASGNAILNVAPEKDGIVRRVPLLAALDYELPAIGMPIYPTLSMEMLRVLQNAPRTMNVRMSGASGDARWTKSEGIEAIRVGELTIPTDSSGYMWVHYSGHQKQRYISASDIINDQLPADTFRNTVVLIGTSAEGLLDLWSSPLDPVLPGVEIHAEMLEQMLTGHFLARPYWAAETETFVLLLIGLFFVLAVPRLGAVWPAAIGATLLISASMVSWWAYESKLLLIDPVYPVISLIAVYISTSSIGFIRTEGERRLIRSAFANYLSPALVDELCLHPERVQLGVEARDMTLMFCDVRDFTVISEGFKSNPQGLTRLINRLLTPLTDCILERKGTIDKYMGDCIMAFWNAPLDVKDHAHHACHSALAMRSALDLLNAERFTEAKMADEPFLPLHIGVGINCGDCLVGNIGSDQRFDYSVLGDAVNLAARLEGQSKNYGIDIVMGEEVAKRVENDFAILELDLIAVKGKREAVHIYALLGDKVLCQSTDFRDFRVLHKSMIDAYRQKKWDETVRLITKCRATSLGTGALYELYELYLHRIEVFREIPPPANWDGVFFATDK
ncbi:MAG: CHASE2 domain-containing protein [Thalassospira sp.]|uniref:CHASE2 domain-containing protein n=1 Tax=Thalassospira sp. TaxID=1912094 RepID=UPI003A84FDA5